MLAQLEGSGRGALGSYNAQAYTDLSSFVQENPLKDGDEWLGLLMKRNEMLGAQPAAQGLGLRMERVRWSIWDSSDPLRRWRHISHDAYSWRILRCR